MDVGRIPLLVGLLRLYFLYTTPSTKAVPRKGQGESAKERFLIFGQDLLFGPGPTSGEVHRRPQAAWWKIRGRGSCGLGHAG